MMAWMRGTWGLFWHGVLPGQVNEWARACACAWGEKKRESKAIGYAPELATAMRESKKGEYFTA
jgi:hypothetical protein